MILAAALLAASDIMAVKAAYDDCVRTQAVRLGAGNQETADTVLRAVRSKCQPAWIALEQAFPSGTGVASAEQWRTTALVRWRSQADDAAVAALLEARAKRP